MWLYNINELVNTKLIYYKSGLVIWRKEVVDDDNIMILVKMVYIVGIGQYIISNDQYQLSKIITLKSLISSYKKTIDELNSITKK